MQSTFKKTKPIRSLAFATALAASMAFSYSPVQAADDKGLYVRGGIGINWLSDADNNGAVLDVESEADNGLALAGALGYRLNRNVRVEAEINYRDNDADSLTVTNPAGSGLPTDDADGDVTSWGGMANVYYDFDGVGPVKDGGKLVPYVMGGLGWANVDADVSAVGVQLTDDDDSVFAYQLGAGVGYDVAERVTLDLGYRYYATDDLDLTFSPDGSDFESDYDNHSVMASVRYAF